MRKMKFMVCIGLFATLSFICSPLKGVAEPIHDFSKPMKITSLKQKDKSIDNKGKYSCCDTKMLVPGNPGIDPKMLVPGNANIDPKMIIKGNTDKDTTKQAPGTNPIEEQPFSNSK